MKTWGWFVIAALWLAAVIAVSKFGGFDISVGNWGPEKLRFGVAVVLLYLILHGWLIPLFIGALRLALALKSKRST